MESAVGGEGRPAQAPAVRQRLRDLEAALQSQAQTLRALERIESLQDRTQALEAENRSLKAQVGQLHTF
ncbi:MAG TPA: hypothetical protein VN648_29630, partial [Candidatus Methylomirabilis sp.]|nr:hypothetical protein [Candidatus Methylomirabilis sp.]